MSRVDFLNAKTSIQFTTQHIETVVFDLAIETHKELACAQALGGAVAAGWKNEGELATTFLEFEDLHRKTMRTADWRR